MILLSCIVVLVDGGTRVLIWYQLGFSLGLPQKWGFCWGGARCEFRPQNRNPKDSTLNNLIGYSLTLAGASQVCKQVKSKNWRLKTSKKPVFKTPQKITQMVPYKILISYSQYLFSCTKQQLVVIVVVVELCLLFL